MGKFRSTETCIDILENTEIVNAPKVNRDGTIAVFQVTKAGEDGRDMLCPYQGRLIRQVINGFHDRILDKVNSVVVTPVVRPTDTICDIHQRQIQTYEIIMGHPIQQEFNEYKAEQYRNPTMFSKLNKMYW